MNKLLLVPIIFLFAYCDTTTVPAKDLSSKAINLSSIDSLVKTLNFSSFSIIVPAAWQIANDDTLPLVADMTTRNRNLLPDGKIIHFVYGNSAWDLSEDYSKSTSHYSEAAEFKAKVFESKADKLFGVYIDSVGTMQPVGSYGFLLYSKGFDTAFRNDLIQTIKSLQL